VLVYALTWFTFAYATNASKKLKGYFYSTPYRAQEDPPWPVAPYKYRKLHVTGKSNWYHSAISTHQIYKCPSQNNRPSPEVSCYSFPRPRLRLSRPWHCR